MTMENDKNLRQDNNADSVSENRDSRRKWLRKISVATPALLLLANRPVMAASCSISGFMSVQVGTSLTTHDPGLCDGWSPGNWKNLNGNTQIGQAAWDATGVSRNTTTFDAIFTTNNLGLTGAAIKKVNNGVVSGDIVELTSEITETFLRVVDGKVKGGNDHGNIVKHAAATYLNAAFLANGGQGSSPDPWMVNYIAPTDVIALYLLYELTHIIGTATGESYIVERNGSMIADGSMMGTGDFADFFHSLSNGSGSQTWQDGL